MNCYRSAGHRPTGWWTFEAHEDRSKSSANETTRLAQLGELSEREVAELRTSGYLGGLSPISGARWRPRWRGAGIRLPTMTKTYHRERMGSGLRRGFPNDYPVVVGIRTCATMSSARRCAHAPPRAPTLRPSPNSPSPCCHPRAASTSWWATTSTRIARDGTPPPRSRQQHNRRRLSAREQSRRRHHPCGHNSERRRVERQLDAPSRTNYAERGRRKHQRGPARARSSEHPGPRSFTSAEPQVTARRSPEPTTADVRVTSFAPWPARCCDAVALGSRDDALPA